MAALEMKSRKSAKDKTTKGAKVHEDIAIPSGGGVDCR
jgi:hypothetical protein